jgi:DNA-3-methyladenine glycosylase
MLNVVTGELNYPAAVLIRSTEVIKGPGRICKQLSITKELNTLPAKPMTGLWFEDRGDDVDPKCIKRTPRIGVNYAGKIWSKKLYRFIIS